MGFGCNAAGVVGCRIIDSPRERMVAMLTNAFVPCNGRFPALIAIITVFFAANALEGAALLSALVALGVVMTLLCSRLLSETVLRGMPSFFTLELPPYRRPQPGRILLRSIYDRTLFVLARAVIVAAPAGALIWALNRLGLMELFSALLDAPGRLMGLNGLILLAFILGLPANEIVIPIILMCVLSQNALTEYASAAELGIILRGAGWTEKTALCFLLFTMFHSPCSTTLLTIRRESGSWRWAALAAALPTAVGAALCILVNLVWA
ncbi:MAG: nucleoside recognition domain-containing protein [Candidatus Heteroscillospira sp.]